MLEKEILEQNKKIRTTFDKNVRAYEESYCPTCGNEIPRRTISVQYICESCGTPVHELGFTDIVENKEYQTYLNDLQFTRLSYEKEKLDNYIFVRKLAKALKLSDQMILPSETEVNFKSDRDALTHTKHIIELQRSFIEKRPLRMLEDTKELRIVLAKLKTYAYVESELQRRLEDYNAQYKLLGQYIYAALVEEVLDFAKKEDVFLSSVPSRSVRIVKNFKLVTDQYVKVYLEAFKSKHKRIDEIIAHFERSIELLEEIEVLPREKAARLFRTYLEYEEVQREVKTSV